LAGPGQFALPGSISCLLAMETKPLSPRQAECLALAARGLSRKQIAFKLDISISTVRTHLSNSFLRLGAAGIANAVWLWCQGRPGVRPGPP